MRQANSPCYNGNMTSVHRGKEGMKGRSAARLILGGVALVLIAATLLPLVREQAWWIRIFDFPRLQLAVAGAVTGILYGALVRRPRLPDLALLLLLVLAVFYQGYRIFPYTPLACEQVAAGSAGEGRAAHLSLLISNVLMDNREIERYIDIIRRYDPDIVIADETDDWWVEQLEILRDRYPHAVTYPLANTYGMSLYSKLPLLDPEVRFLVEEHVPSIHTRVELRSGAAVMLHSLHPEPPHPVRSKDTEERDAELLIVARQAAATTLPVIVAGDLNDVAWSHTTRLFQKISGLLDPRIGRGMYNTYHAGYPLLRFPLDHIFHSAQFELIRLEKGPAFGSDHFPVFVELRLAPEKAPTGQPPTSSPASREEAEERIRKAQ
jgi:endonuclease/exonuclease/phosphatase (EEP) superfamily protein YafD